MMGPQRILVVEDNPTTLKMLRVVLSGEGFDVEEALDARAALDRATRAPPDLVLQDLILPDMNGFELVRRLRQLPGINDIPILALSGFVGMIEDRSSAEAGFTSLLVKPVEPDRLVETVRAFLPKRGAAPEPRAEHRRLLLVDDNLVQLKLARIHFSQLGFEVTAASTASDALRLARAERPEVILSDVLMPDTDGFELCLELRRDKSLAAVPVVLLSAQYRTEVDQNLARRVGANALVSRTPDLAEALAAVLEAVKRGAPGMTAEPSVEVKLEHAQVVTRQLERQLAVSSGLAQRCTVQAAQLSLLGGVADAISKNTDPNAAMHDVLATTLDAAGISKGALLLQGDQGALRLQDSIGFSEGEQEALRGCFGQRALFDAVVAQRVPLSVPSPTVSSTISDQILAGADTASLHVVPLVSDGHGVGAMVLAARRNDVTSSDAVAFARAMGNQMVQSLALANAFARLTASEARYRTLLATATDAIAVLTPDGVIREVNRRWEEILGKPLEALVGNPIHDFIVHHGEGASIDVERSRVPAHSPAARPVEVRRADGSSVLLEFSNTALVLAGEQLVLAVARDVTAQVQAQELLLISERMASVGSLAAAVAHEINNPLAAVSGNLELVSKSVDLSYHDGVSINLGEVRDEIFEARTAADRVRSIVRDLRIFSRSEEDERGPVDVHRLLDSALRMAGNEIRHRARVVKEYGTIPLVMANESRLSQVFLNLLVNAAQAIPEGHANSNEVRVRTYSDAAKDQVAIEISDTGSGISPESLRKLFRPFFTTKAAGMGTGLGLAICQRIVAGFGGEVRVERTSVKGTTFRVALPATRADARLSIQVTAAPPAERRGNVLVVDDERMIGKMTQRSLSPEHDVSVLTSAEEALRRVTAGERFDVILCDLMMPTMTGMELYTALVSVAPDQAERMIFLTGGAFTPQTRAFLDDVTNARLEKPFQLEALRALVNARLT
jgi:PAS domain S-box-containing protein